MTTARDLWLVALLLGTTTRIGAQAAERAVFVVRVGKDTFAVETATIRALEFEADLRRRTPLLRVQRRITFSPTLQLRSLDVTAGGGPQGDSARVHYALSVAGDSAEVRTDAVGVSCACSAHPASAWCGTLHRSVRPRSGDDPQACAVCRR
jgi:hypothetical protein